MAGRRRDINRQRREAAKERILEGSLRVFSRRGFHAASVQEIAEDAGVSKGLPYNYFRSKEELLSEALNRRIDHLSDLGKRMETIRSPRARLRAWIDGLLDYVSADPAAFRLYFALSLDSSLSPDLLRAIELQREKLNRYLGAIESVLAELGSRDPKLDLFLLRATLLGLCLRLARPIEPFPRKALMRRVLELFGSSK